MQPPKPVETLAELIETVRKLFESDEVDVELVKSILASYKSKPSEWNQYAFFESNRYTKNLVDTGNDKYNLILVCWSGGSFSKIHDHSNCHCFMKMLSGSLNEIRYEWPEQASSENDSMKVLSEDKMLLNDVNYISDSLGLHKIENASQTEQAVSLHLYIPPINDCYIFDESTGRRIKVKTTFHSQYGKRTPFQVTHGSNKYGKEVLTYEKVAGNV